MFSWSFYRVQRWYFRREWRLTKNSSNYSFIYCSCKSFILYRIYIDIINWIKLNISFDHRANVLIDEQHFFKIQFDVRFNSPKTETDIYVDWIVKLFYFDSTLRAMEWHYSSSIPTITRWRLCVTEVPV